MSLQMIALLILLGLFVFTVLAHLLIPQPIPGIPYNRLAAYSPWGDLPGLALYNFRTQEVFSWLSRQHLLHDSPLVQLFLPNYSITRPVVLVADLREIEDITLRRNSIFDRASLMHGFFAVLYPRAMVCMKTTEEFREQKRLWNALLLPGFLNDVTARCCFDSAVNVVELWQKKMELGGNLPFTFGEDLRQAGLDIVWETMLGNKLGLVESQRRFLQQEGSGCLKRRSGVAVFKTRYPPFYRALRTLLFYLDLVVQGVSPPIYTWVFHRLPTFCKARQLVDDVLKGEFNDARVRLACIAEDDLDTRPSGLEQVLLRATQALAQTPEYSTIKDDLLELLVFGHETTASTLSWALKYLSDHPHVQSSLHMAIYRVFPNSSNNLPSHKEILKANIPYLDAVIAETFRLSSTGPVSFRETTVDTEILGRPIPARTSIILITGGPSYNERAHPFSVHEADRSSSSRAHPPHQNWDIRWNLEHFVPDRWLKQDSKGQGFVFDARAGPSLPFSTGLRGCFGKKIAMMELKVMLVVLTMRFEFEQLEARLSKYSAYDGLTRSPTCSYIRPKYLVTELKSI